MTFRSSFLRILCLLGPCAWLSLPFAISPSAVVDHPQSTNGKPIAHFVDVAQKAGLSAPVIFGGESTKKDIIETTGTGVPIFYYDNHGRPATFFLNGTTPHPAPPAKVPT